MCLGPLSPFGFELTLYMRLLSIVWLFWWARSTNNNSRQRSYLPVDSIMSCYLDLESGKFWFPAQVIQLLLKLFDPRPPLEYKPPPEKRMAQFVSKFAEPGDPE
ncbi:F-box protein At2g32560-like [Tripterygium wilfordii]|uniref:F-box protein At2g32560-like n=1 Tax=Tripterygium wilfordii TaxID=458696 RepID=UPI0018F8498A|nr:F-box protein At2g32560-like [Tripterygium wilfordii]